MVDKEILQLQDEIVQLRDCLGQGQFTLMPANVYYCVNSFNSLKARADRKLFLCKQLCRCYSNRIKI